MLDDAQSLPITRRFASRTAIGAVRTAWRPSLNWRLAWRNLAHDRVRLAITVVGVTFSVVLMALQLALLIGFAATSSSLIDRSQADFWIVPKGTRNVDQSADLTERRRYQALAVPGVASAEQLLVKFLPWKRPDGGVEVVVVVGVDPEHPAVSPWNFVAGSIASLKTPDGIVIDDLYAKKLGIDRIGETVEINGHRARVAGFTHGIRAFTQSPYIFAALKTAQTLADLPADRSTYVLVRADRGDDLARLRGDLRARFPDLDVKTASAFSWQTRGYWLLTTGAGVALVLAAGLGLIVGVVIVAQTLYAATVERLPEYATLRAMGADNSYLHHVILKQSTFGAAIGYALGMLITGVTLLLARNSVAALQLPWPVVFLLALVTLLMCSGGAVISIRKVLHIDPAMVFK